MAQRRSLAVLVLMLVLSLAPSLALAAAVCGPHCCPAVAVGPADGDATDEANPAAQDCRAGLANRSCCTTSLAPLSLPAPALSDGPPLVLQPTTVEPLLGNARLPAPERRSEAQRALRTSSLRLSVVLLI